MHHKSLQLLLLLALLAQSCCRKRGCIERVEEEIIFKLNTDISNKGFSTDEIKTMVMVLYNPTTGARIDSSLLDRYNRFNFGEPYNTGIYGYNEVYLRELEKTTKGMNIIVKAIDGSFADTLFAIDFEEKIHTYTCGSCFFSSNKEQAPYISNRSLTFRGNFITEDNWPVVISKF